MKDLLKKNKIPYKDFELYEKALTHSSYAHENQVDKNERLEFLGDSILEVFISDYFYHNYKDLDEGELTKKRARAVCEEALVIYAKEIGLEKHLKIGKGEILKGPNDAMIADAFEAFLAAIYLDLGFYKAKKIFNKLVIPHLDKVDLIRDFKSLLQEYIQSGDKRTISYRLEDESGPSHNKTFVVSVRLDKNIILGRGTGKTKKEAEQKAAENALSKRVKSNAN